MDWDLKMPNWDLAELERDAEPNIGSVVGQSAASGPEAGRPDCSVDLKLGGLGDFGSSEKWKGQSRAPAVVSSALGPSKRARTPNSGGHIASCLVDGCKSDLSSCREYHRRHKVCEAHSKTPIVMVGGQEQRFCQQCSRFHLLIEFDEVKRSCRKRLDGHNRRRRKPQPNPLVSGRMFSNHQGIRFSSYPQIFSSPAPQPSWTQIAKSEQSALNSHHQSVQQSFPISFSGSYKGGKQFPFLQDAGTVLNSRKALETSASQALSMAVTSPESSSSSKMFPSDDLTQVLDSDCALSLLSYPNQTSGINLSRMGPTERIPVGQPIVSSMQYDGFGRYSRSQASNNVSPTGFSCSGMEDEHGSSVLVADANDVDLHCQGIYHVGTEGSSEGGSHTLPFSWQ